MGTAPRISIPVEQPPTRRGDRFRSMGRHGLGVLHKLVLFAGVVALAMIVLAFTRLPFDAQRWLALEAGACTGEVDLVVILGGSGMPSGPELLRLHHGAAEARRWPAASVLVVHPKDTGVVHAMVDELVLRGVAAERISSVLEGTSTREQALEVHRVLAAQPAARVALVTAPENMYRSVSAFRKAGLEQVCGSPAFDHAMFVDLDYDHRRLGGARYAPDVSGSMGLRYNFWNYLKLEITCLREYAAIAYYRLNGWI
jgi:uncharacterized SAM-binding protein YcdF (DUF218 family)